MVNKLKKSDDMTSDNNESSENNYKKSSYNSSINKIIFDDDDGHNSDILEDCDNIVEDYTNQKFVKKNTPWIEKYRVKKLENILGQDQIIKMLQPYLNKDNNIQNQNLPHLIFYGPPGTGKTSTILALAYELFGPKRVHERILELNASDNKGINFVRGDIKNFSNTINGTADPDYPSPNFKIIILDEADSMTPDAQAALRKSMEKTADKTKFCIICNYVNKIIEPIKSRCVPIYFKPLSNKILLSKLKFIAQNEKINFKDEIFNTIIDISEGDTRNAINILYHASCILNCNKKISVEDILNISGNIVPDVLNNIWNTIISKNVKEIKELTLHLISSAYNIENILKYLAQKNITSGYSDKKNVL